MSPPRRSASDRAREVRDRILTDTQEMTDSDSGDVGRFIRVYLRPHAASLCVTVAVMAVWALVPMGFPLTHQRLIDNILAAADAPGGVSPGSLPHLMAGVWWVFWANIGLHTLNLLCHLSTSYLQLRTGRSLALRLREHLYHKLDTLQVGFHEQTQTGRIVSRIQHDVSVVQNAASGNIASLLIEPFKLVAGLTVLFVMNWRLTLLLVAVLPIYALIFVRLRPLIRRNSNAQSRVNSRLYGLVDERLSAITLVKAFAQERRELARFSRTVNEGVRLALFEPLYTQGLSLASSTITAVTSGLVLFVGLAAVRDARLGMTLGSVVAYLQIANYMFQPIQILTNAMTSIQGSLVSLRRVFALLDQREDFAPGHVQLRGIRGKIHFDHVSFTYPHQERPALDDVNLLIHPGERIAVMGPSGSGKSTLFQLLLDFYRPQEGAVRIDDIDLVDAELASVRRHIRLVQQEAFIFSGTLRENIAYGYPNARQDDIEEAARMAELHAFIRELPDGYDTVVGARGMSLSGGQRQRLALATALLTDPEVLLLDDTTSALDAETEARIRTTLAHAFKGRTGLIITHRVATARDCDRIVVLEQGRITQVGTHRQLSGSGFYGRICAQQSGR